MNVIYLSLQVESNDVEEGILKQEVEVLKQLENRPFSVRLFHAGKRTQYRWVEQYFFH